jgi:chromosome segregation ATPase
MLKKLVIMGVIGFVTVAAVKGSKFGSYLRSEFSSIRDRAEANIPPEREIARLRSEIKQLDKDILAIVNQLAKERVEVRQLEEKAKDLRASQGRAKNLLTARASAIKSGTEPVSFDNRNLSLNEAKAVLEEGVKRYTANQKALESMEAALASRERVRDTLDLQLEAMKTQKTELTAAVDALEAELTALKLQQMESKYQTDDTRLAKIKEGIQALRTRGEAEREKLNLLPVALDEPAKSTSNKSVDDIMAPLNGSKSTPDID